MKTIKTGLRIILALPLIIFGLNGFLHFIPMPEISQEAGAFLGAIGSTKLFFPLMSIIEILAGVMLLANKAVPVALILIFPILLCAVIYHLVLDPNGTLIAGICIILTMVLMSFNKDKYLNLLTNE